MSKSLMLLDPKGNPGFRFLVREMKLRDGRVVGIKSGVAQLVLHESRKEWVAFDKVGHITANGYREINRAAGLTIVEPPTIFVEGSGFQPNPHSDIDPKTGAWMGGKMRLIAVGRDVTGKMAIADYTNRMTLHSMVNESLLAVKKRRPTAVLWGFRETSPADLMEEALHTFNEDIDEEIEQAEYWAKKGKGRSKKWKQKLKYDQAGIAKAREKAARRVRAGLWCFRVVDPMTGQGLWYDIQDVEVGKAFAQFSKNDEIGIRKLKGTTYRNVSRDHPATPGMILGPEQIIGQVEGERTAKVTVYFHEQVEDRADLEELLAQFADGVEIANATIVKGAGETTVEDVDDSDDEAPEETGPPPESDEQPTQAEAERAATIEDIHRLRDSLPDEVLAKISFPPDLTKASNGELLKLRGSLLDWKESIG